jgi:hypothetical protein
VNGLCRILSLSTFVSVRIKKIEDRIHKSRCCYMEHKMYCSVVMVIIYSSFVVRSDVKCHF